MTVKKLIISKGRTEPQEPEPYMPWHNATYTLEIDLPDNCSEETLQATRATHEKMIDEWLREPIQPVPLAMITMEEIEKMQWKASNWVRREDQDRRARIGEDAWIKREEADYRLEKMIQASPRKNKKGKPELELPPYTFGFAGGNDCLIVRKATREKAK